MDSKYRENILLTEIVGWKSDWGGGVFQVETTNSLLGLKVRIPCSMLLGVLVYHDCFVFIVEIYYLLSFCCATLVGCGIDWV